MALLKEAVALDTGFATAYRTLGTYQGFLGDREGEVAALTRAVRHRDRLTEAEREHTRGLYHLLVTGRLDQSVAAYRGLLERHPDDTLARNNLGAIYNALHQPARAESILRPGVGSSRAWGPGFHVNLAYSLVALGRRAEAERMLEQAARIYPEEPRRPVVPGAPGHVQGRLFRRRHRCARVPRPVRGNARGAYHPVA